MASEITIYKCRTCGKWMARERSGWQSWELDRYGKPPKLIICACQDYADQATPNVLKELKERITQ